MDITGKIYNKNCDTTCTDLKLSRKGGENFVQQTKFMKTNA
jgi:hypothetical protein